MVWQKRPSAEHSIPAQVEQMTKWVNLSRELDKCLATYSGGMKQQLLLASVLQGDPKKQVQLRELLAEMAKDQIILVATHVVSDMETVATEILLLKNSKLENQAPVKTLIEVYAPGQDLKAVYL